MGENPYLPLDKIGALVTTAQRVSIVITVLVPIVTVVAGVLGVMFQDWRVRRSQAGRRQLALEDARQQVTFAAEWWNAKKLLSDSTEAVQEATSSAAAWLDMASAQVKESEIPTTEEKRRITLRRLLLFYPIQGTGANIIRGIFYIVLGILIFYTGTVISDILEPAGRRYALGDLVISIAISLVALSLRFWAVSAQTQREKKRRFRWETIRRGFLLYHLGGFMASFLRVVFYVVLSVVIVSAVAFSKVPAKFPSDAGFLLALVGYAVGLRYWAASLGKTLKNDKADNELPSNNY